MKPPVSPSDQAMALGVLRVPDSPVVAPEAQRPTSSQYVVSMIREEEKLGITQEQLADMIQRGVKAR